MIGFTKKLKEEIADYKEALANCTKERDLAKHEAAAAIDQIKELVRNIENQSEVIRANIANRVRLEKQINEIKKELPAIAKGLGVDIKNLTTKSKNKPSKKKEQ